VTISLMANILGSFAFLRNKS